MRPRVAFNGREQGLSVDALLGQATQLASAPVVAMGSLGLDDRTTLCGEYRLIK
jgi:hypothetical protein